MFHLHPKQLIAASCSQTCLGHVTLVKNDGNGVIMAEGQVLSLSPRPTARFPRQVALNAQAAPVQIIKQCNKQLTTIITITTCQPHHGFTVSHHGFPSRHPSLRPPTCMPGPSTACGSGGGSSSGGFKKSRTLRATATDFRSFEFRGFVFRVFLGGEKLKLILNKPTV